MIASSELQGLIQCSGGISARHMKVSQHALFEYLSEAQSLTGPDGQVDKSLGIERKRRFILLLVKLYEASFKKDRMSVPLMVTVEKLLQANYFTEMEIQPDLHELHKVTVAETSRTQNVKKLHSCVGVMAGLLASEDTDLQKKAIKTMLFMLYHKFPRIRAYASQQLYTGLLALEDYEAVMPGGEDAYDDFQELIAETEWDRDESLIKETKTAMYGFFGLEPKAPAKKEANTQDAQIKT